MQSGWAMGSFDKAIAHLSALRRKFEGLLEAAREKSAADPAARAARRTVLRELTAFGSNPGNLRMFVHAPERLPSQAPLVVALHGCGQTADDYDCGSGWSALADRLGFAVVYPQQQPANNPKTCFSWFLPGHTARGRGEARSIQQMVEHAIAAFGIDRGRVFVTGLSAGGAMTAVMLATYPELFAGGAIIAGVPYGSARSVQQAFDAMFTEQTNPADVLGDRVRSASNHPGPWPKISVWHGTADLIVKPSNSEEIIRQWLDVHGLSAVPSTQESIGGHDRRVWTDADGETLIEAFSIAGMAHGVPLATSGEHSYGATGAFFHDAGISSTHRIAKFWRLDEGVTESNAAALPPIRATGGAVAAAPEAAGGSDDAREERYRPNPGAAAAFLDPNAVIAAAFKAAGLPAPEVPKTAAAAQAVAVPFIQAALKAAGLKR
jgi:poly(hydroxyalkanoate) depolymerase family esterase